MDTDKRIQEFLTKLPFDATKIIIAQRISATKNADKIFILEDGKVQEFTIKIAKKKRG